MPKERATMKYPHKVQLMSENGIWHTVGAFISSDFCNQWVEFDISNRRCRPAKVIPDALAHIDSPEYAEAARLAAEAYKSAGQGIVMPPYCDCINGDLPTAPHHEMCATVSVRHQFIGRDAEKLCQLCQLWAKDAVHFSEATVSP